MCMEVEGRENEKLIDYPAVFVFEMEENSNFLVIYYKFMT